MTLLSTIQAACDLLTVTRPSVAFVSTTADDRLLMALLKATGVQLVKAHDWNALLTVESLTCAATTAQTGYPVAAFERLSDGTEMWNETNDWPIHGPVSSREWRDLIVRDVVTLPQYWRLIGGVLNIHAPASGDTISYEYVSNAWVNEANGGTYGAEFTADTDTFVFDEWLLVLGLVWRWKQTKGLNYAEDLVTYNECLAGEIKKDQGGLKRIKTDRFQPDRLRRQWHGSIVTS